MRYFELLADKDISNPIQLENVDRNLYSNELSKEEFTMLPPLMVGYFANAPQIEIYDTLQEPAFLLSDRLKRLFSLFEPDMEFKGIQLFANDLQDKTAPLYWMPYILPLDCLSKKTKKYPNGMLEQMILDINVPIEYSVFRVTGLLENKVIVSLAVAESMIRRKMSGITFVPVVFANDGGEHEDT